MRARTEQLTGWGRTAPSVAEVVEVSTEEIGSLASERASQRGIIARGLGRAYGDPAQNGGGTVVRVLPGPDPIRLDEEAGTATVDAGISFDVLLRRIVPRGWFVPVSPGTRFVTVGGAIASDIHGKNHHADLTFGHHVRRLGIVLADGTHRSITAASDPDLWWATLGGMGLTGIITDATFDLVRIETSACLVDTDRAPNLDVLLDLMESGDDQYRYSVAWVDMVATGTSMGRGVLQRGDHATLDQLRDHVPVSLAEPLAFDPGTLADMPRIPNVMHRPIVRAFNELWYRKAPRKHTGIESITGFFHPLDGVGNWNRVYGRHGFLQYQFVVPFEAVESLRWVIARVSSSGHSSAVSVLKRFGAASGGMLSFPIPGWTLTVDLPASVPGLGSLLADLDERVIAAGGRHYLAKDAHTTADVIRAGYPRLEEWRSVRSAVDPQGVWASDQARRLRLL